MGLALLENAYHETCKVVALEPAHGEAVEQRALERTGAECGIVTLLREALGHRRCHVAGGQQRLGLLHGVEKQHRHRLAERRGVEAVRRRADREGFGNRVRLHRLEEIQPRFVRDGDRRTACRLRAVNSAFAVLRETELDEFLVTLVNFREQ